MSIYKACDIRGKYGDELRNEHAVRLGLALAQYCGKVDVLVGGDGRLSTPALQSHLVAALRSAGCRAVNLGSVPTPALYFARRHLGIPTAVMVTASHNPAADNGFKLSLGTLPITPEDIVTLSQIMENLPDSRIHSAQQTVAPVGGVRSFNVLPDYIAFAQSQARALDDMRVVVDCANGAAALVARDVWQNTGARVSYLFDAVDGTFPNHAPDPSNAGSLHALQKEVVAQQADLGVAYDGDGDRVVFVDEHGQPLSGDRAIVLFAREALRAGPAPIVYDQKCSLIVAEAIRNAGGQPIIERSGHTFIKTSFLKQGAPYAGEISGHHFFRLLQGDDGIIASLYMANMLQKSGTSLARLAESIKTYPITPDIRLKMDSATANRVLNDLERELIGEAQLVKLDGLRAEFTDGWGIARLSVTEPAMTLRFEGKDTASLNRVMHRFMQAAPDLAGRLPIANSVSG
ncbi:MAG: phosphomannomutase/phosphoglucomutase [Chloroflexi bacterium]|nr:phosphomannomutase/phosphoglucomutase [Chloroflexota bacterium]MCL5273772.1 phosphomannomutase/phosphoglucomutase [Chloroflexota bacterium]